MTNDSPLSVRDSTPRDSLFFDLDAELFPLLLLWEGLRRGLFRTIFAHRCLGSTPCSLLFHPEEEAPNEANRQAHRLLGTDF